MKKSTCGSCLQINLDVSKRPQKSSQKKKKADSDADATKMKGEKASRKFAQNI